MSWTGGLEGTAEESFHIPYEDMREWIAQERNGAKWKW